MNYNNSSNTYYSNNTNPSLNSHYDEIITTNRPESTVLRGRTTLRPLGGGQLPSQQSSLDERGLSSSSSSNALPTTYTPYGSSSSSTTLPSSIHTTNTNIMQQQQHNNTNGRLYTGTYGNGNDNNNNNTLASRGGLYSSSLSSIDNSIDRPRTQVIRRQAGLAVLQNSSNSTNTNTNSSSSSNGGITGSNNNLQYPYDSSSLYNPGTLSSQNSIYNTNPYQNNTGNSSNVNTLYGRTSTSNNSSVTTTPRVTNYYTNNNNNNGANYGDNSNNNPYLNGSSSSQQPSSHSLSPGRTTANSNSPYNYNSNSNNNDPYGTTNNNNAYSSSSTSLRTNPNPGKMIIRNNTLNNTNNNSIVSRGGIGTEPSFMNNNNSSSTYGSSSVNNNNNPNVRRTVTRQQRLPTENNNGNTTNNLSINTPSYNDVPATPQWKQVTSPGGVTFGSPTSSLNINNTTNMYVNPPAYYRAGNNNSSMIPASRGGNMYDATPNTNNMNTSNPPNYITAISSTFGSNNSGSDKTNTNNNNNNNSSSFGQASSLSRTLRTATAEMDTYNNNNGGISNNNNTNPSSNGRIGTSMNTSKTMGNSYNTNNTSASQLASAARAGLASSNGRGNNNMNTGSSNNNNSNSLDLQSPYSQPVRSNGFGTIMNSSNMNSNYANNNNNNNSSSMGNNSLYNNERTSTALGRSTSNSSSTNNLISSPITTTNNTSGNNRLSSMQQQRPPPTTSSLSINNSSSLDTYGHSSSTNNVNSLSTHSVSSVGSSNSTVSVASVNSLSASTDSSTSSHLSSGGHLNSVNNSNNNATTVVPNTHIPSSSSSTTTSMNNPNNTNPAVSSLRSVPNGTEDVIALPHRVVTSVTHVQAVGAVSWRGRNPNTTKINQDAVVVAEHGPTASLLVAVFDGHGVNGREVSSFFKERYPLALFTDKRFQTRVPPANRNRTGAGSPLHYRSAKTGNGNASDGESTLDDDGSSQASDVINGKARSPNKHKQSTATGSTNIAASALCDVMADVLLATELALIQASGINVTLSGSTSVVVLIRDGILHIVNIGDSRGILSSAPQPAVPLPASVIAAASAGSTLTGNPALAPGQNLADNDAVLTHPSVRVRILTVDHKPDMPKERQRIISCGGRVMSTRIKGAPHLLGPPRVWLKNAPLPGLNMSRSLGDLIAKQAGVISTPHKAIHAIVPSDRALILASDGLWDFVSNEETSSIALSTNDTWESAARLARLARSRWLTKTLGADDTTVVIVRLGTSNTNTTGGNSMNNGGISGINNSGNNATTVTLSTNIGNNSGTVTSTSLSSS